MARMLIISDRIKRLNEGQEKLTDVERKTSQVEIFSWASETPRLSDYEIVVLDMKINFRPLKRAFINKREDIYKLLEAGGVVICITNDRVTFHYDFQSEDNYDWLKTEDSYGLNFHVDNGPGKNILVKSKNDFIIKYFQNVDSYHKTIGESKHILINEKEGTLAIHLGNDNIYRLNVFAVNRVTEEPIACEIKIDSGSLIFLPTNNLLDMELMLENLHLFNDLISLIYNFANELYEKNKEEGEKSVIAPEWIGKYKHIKEIELEKSIEEKKKETEELISQSKKYEIINSLLYGYDNDLENAVKKVFEEFGCEVEKTEKGSPIDLKIQHKRLNLKFAVEVTGVKGKIEKDTKKIGQLWSYIPLRDNGEFILLIANTYRDLDPDKRKGQENFTRNVIELALNNKFALLTGLDIFHFWKEFMDGKSADDILKKIADIVGEFRTNSI
jgi:hypothetical protein